MFYTLFYRKNSKETKTIADRGQKQIKAIEDNKNQLTNTNANDYKNELLISKER